MKRGSLTSMIRAVAIALALLAAVAWLQQQHLADAAHERALLVLVLVGFLALWMAQGRRR